MASVADVVEDGNGALLDAAEELQRTCRDAERGGERWRARGMGGEVEEGLVGGGSVINKSYPV